MPEVPEPPDFEKIFENAIAEGGVPDFPNPNSFEEFALGQHVFYKCWRAAGFSPAQAIWLIGVGLTGTPGEPPSVDDSDETEE